MLKVRLFPDYVTFASKDISRPVSELISLHLNLVHKGARRRWLRLAASVDVHSDELTRQQALCG